MFHVAGTILCVLQLVLRVFPKPILDTFYKDPKIAAIFTTRGLKFFLGYNNIQPFFLSIPAFVLCLASANAILNKRGTKRSAILFVGSSCIKMVFVLLAKPIAIQIRFCKIQVEKASFERLFLWFYEYWRCQSLNWSLSLIFNGIYVSLHK